MIAANPLLSYFIAPPLLKVFFELPGVSHFFQAHLYLAGTAEAMWYLSSGLAYV